MQGYFLSGRVVDVAIAMLVLEFVVIAWLHRRGGHVVKPIDVVGALASGLFLLLALRFALTGAGWPWMATAMLAAFAAHLVDLARRCRARGGAQHGETAVRDPSRNAPQSGIERTDPGRPKAAPGIDNRA